MYTNIYKLKSLKRSLIFISLLTFIGVCDVNAAGALSVNSIEAIRTSAIAGSSYETGWKWSFDITLPDNEPMLKMLFNNWSNGTNTIAAGGNMRYYSPQSINASNTSSAIPVNFSSTYANSMIFATSTDLQATTSGIQVMVIVETKVPSNISGSNYSATYGLKSTPINAETYADFSNGYTDAPVSYAVNGDSIDNLIWNRNINISNGSAKILNFKIKKTGSADSLSFSNLKLKIDGVTVATTSELNNANEAIFDISLSPYLLSSGLKSIQVYSDVGNLAAGKNFRFTLSGSNDISMEDTLTPGLPLIATTNGGSDIINLRSGNTSVNTLYLVTATDNQINSSLISDATDMTIASYTMKAYNEPARISNLTFSPTMSSMITVDSTTDNLPNVSLYVNGNKLGTSQTIISGNNFTFSGLSNDFIVGTSASTTVEIKANIKTINNIPYTGGTLRIDMASANDNATGYSSNVINSTSYLLGQSRSISSHGVQMINNNLFIPTAIAANTANYKIGSFIINTDSSDGARLITLNVTLLGSMISNGHISNLVLKNGVSVVGSISNVVAGESNSFFLNTLIGPSTSYGLDLYVDILSNASSGENINSTVSVLGRTDTSAVLFTTPIINSVNITLP